MRVRLLVAESKAIAVPRRSASTASLIKVRRTGKSVDQPSPLKKATSASTQSATSPSRPLMAMNAEPSAIDENATISVNRRSKRSTTAPIKVPKSTIGAIRATTISETTSADPETSNA